MRVHPITGVTKLHPSADDDAPTAPPSLPPTTKLATLRTVFRADGIVTAGQRIGNVDSAGYSPGGHYGYAHITVKQGNQP